LDGVSAALGAVALALPAIYEYGTRSFEKNREGKVDYALEKPFMVARAGGQIASVHNRAYQAIQGKDLSYLAAYNTALHSKDFRASLGAVGLQKEKLELAAGTSPVSLSGNAKLFLSEMGSLAGRSTQWLMEKIGGAPLSQLGEADKMNLKEIALRSASYSLTGEQTQKFLGGVGDTQHMQGGMFNTMANRIGSDSMNRVNMMRMSGRSTGFVTSGPNKGALAVEDLQSRLIPGGWDISDDAAGYQSLLSVGKGYGKAISRTWGIQGGKMAGLSNIEQLINMGGMLGGSVAAARQFAGSKSILQRSIGTGGLDVAVGRDMFTQMGQQMLGTGQFGAGNAASTYLGMAAGLVGGVNEKGRATLDVAEQQRRLLQLTKGDTAFAGITQGKHAPMYQATSLLGAINAMGGEYSMGAEQLSRMDPKLIASIARGGNSPAGYAALGIGKEQAGSFLRYQNRMMFAEVTDDMVRGEAGDVLARVRGSEKRGGSFINTINDAVAGMKGKSRVKEADRLLDIMSTTIGGSLGMDPDTAKGMLMGQLTTQEDWARGFAKTGGAGVAAPKGLEAAQLKKEGEIKGQESTLGNLQDIAANTEKIYKAIERQTELLMGSDSGARAADKIVRGSSENNQGGGLDSSLNMSTQPEAATPSGNFTFVGTP
jgi:hypothetical protein